MLHNEQDSEKDHTRLIVYHNIRQNKIARKVKNILQSMSIH